MNREQDPRPEGRDEVVTRVGVAIARRFDAHPTDGRPTPILAEGSVMVALPAPITDAALALPASPRRVWPWIASAVVAAGIATGGYLVQAERAQAEALAARYPIVADAAQRSNLERDVARWTAGRTRLLAALAAFDPPSLQSMTGVGACPLQVAAPTGRAVDVDADVSTRIVLLPGEDIDGLDALARPELDAMVAAARRGRFRSEAARAHVVQAIAGAFLVVQLAEVRTSTPGVAAGTAYAFDPASGTLRCAGTFRAEASIGLEAETDLAIARSLRAID